MRIVCEFLLCVKVLIVYQWISLGLDPKAWILSLRPDDNTDWEREGGAEMEKKRVGGVGVRERWRGWRGREHIKVYMRDACRRCVVVAVK